MKCVLLGERHHQLGDGVRGLLETEFNAVFIVADETSLLEGAARLQPMLVVVDLALAKGDLPSLLAAVRKQAPAAKVLLLSVHDQTEVADVAVAASADGLVLKHQIATDLMRAVDALLAGHRFMSPAAGVNAQFDSHYRG